MSTLPLVTLSRTAPASGSGVTTALTPRRRASSCARSAAGPVIAPVFAVDAALYRIGRDERRSQRAGRRNNFALRLQREYRERARRREDASHASGNRSNAKGDSLVEDRNRGRQLCRVSARRCSRARLYDPFDPELVAARERARDLCQALNATREAEQQERRRHPERAVRPGWRDGVDAAAVLLRLRRQHRARRACVLQLQLRRAGRLPGAHRELHALRPCGADLHADASVERRACAASRSSASPSTSARTCGSAAERSSCPASVSVLAAVIGAGSVVTRDVPERMFAAGNPCRVIREITE